MGFGLSGDNDRTKMVGGDVTIAWMDHGSGKLVKTMHKVNFKNVHKFVDVFRNSQCIVGQGYAEDYYLDAKSQCAGGRGSCPDRNIRKGKVYVRSLFHYVLLFLRVGLYF